MAEAWDSVQADWERTSWERSNSGGLGYGVWDALTTGSCCGDWSKC